MLKEEYYMNRETGEILTATAAIHDFYKTHGALDRWTDLWIFTGDYAETTITAPNFINVINV